MSKTQRKVVLPSGDTILTTNRRTQILTKEDLRFFMRDTLNLDGIEDSLYYRDTKYKSLEEAASNVNELISEIKEEQEKKEKNQSLSFKLSQKKRGKLFKEKQAEEEWEKKKEEDALKLTVNDMVDLYAKYGDKPTYYINGVEVSESVANQLRSSEILSSQFKTKNITSRNPNGEIWLEVPIPVAQSILPNNASTSRAFIDTKRKYADDKTGFDSENRSSQSQQINSRRMAVETNDKTDGRSNPSSQESEPSSVNSIISRRKTANRPDLEEDDNVQPQKNNRRTENNRNQKSGKEPKKNSNQNKTITFNLKGGR